MTHLVREVENYFLSKDYYYRDHTSLFLYYANVWSMVLRDEPLFDEQFICTNKPVADFKNFIFERFEGMHIRKARTGELNIQDESELDFHFDDDELFLLDSVWRTYGSMSYHDLRYLTDYEVKHIYPIDPKIYRQKIDLNDGLEYYRSLYEEVKNETENNTSL